MGFKDVVELCCEYILDHWKSIVSMLVLFVIAFILIYYVYIPNEAAEDGSADSYKKTFSMFGALSIIAGGIAVFVAGFLADF